MLLNTRVCVCVCVGGRTVFLYISKLENLKIPIINGTHRNKILKDVQDL